MHVVARSTFRSQKLTRSEHFWAFRCRFVWQAQGILHLAKNRQNVMVCSISKSHGRRGAFKDLQRCIFRGSRSTRDMFIRAVRRSGPWFPERRRILEHEIFRFATMILRDRCSSLRIGLTFSWQAQYFKQMEWKNCKTHWHETTTSVPTTTTATTSSTTQGGGGSFKKWKPIGELGCCESRMAERIH